MFELRPYQREAIDALYAHWRAGGGNAIIDLATGTGKSLLNATLCQELLEKWPDMRIGAVTHVKELIVQNTQELIKLWPGAPVGVYSAGVGRRDRNAKILTMGIQSAWNKDLGDFDLIIVDEGHLIPRNAETMYGKFIASCLVRVPDMRLVTLTATPYRLDSGRLDEGPGALFEKVVYTYGIADGVRDGYLCPLISPRTRTELSVKGIKVRGDFISSETEGAAMEGDYIARTVAEIRERGQDRSGWLVFCAGVAHCHAMKDEFARNGVAVGVVTGETPSGERDHLIKSFKNKQLRCLLSVAVLTTGFNAPHVDLIAMCRPTLSTGLYVQQIGRGTRLSPGKANCLVLDFAGNIRRHGPVDAISVKGGGKGPGETQVRPNDIRAKECPRCETLVAIQCRVCPHCEYDWPKLEEQKHEDVPDTETPVMVSNLLPEWLIVNDMTVSRHAKGDNTPSLRVSYLCGLNLRSEWVFFEHTGFPRQRAVSWWRQMGGHLPMPATVKEAMDREKELNTPTSILIRHGAGKFAEIVGRKFDEVAQETHDLEDYIPF
jgi:DNA repair protein RadD